MEVLVNIDVPDLERAIRFYEEGLGLRLKRKLFAGTVAEMAGGSAPIYLLTKPQGSAAIPGMTQSRGYDRHWTPVHLDFVVTDIDSAIVRVEKAGAKLEQGPRASTWGKLAMLSDPFGHGLCLIEWRDGGYGEIG